MTLYYFQQLISKYGRVRNHFPRLAQLVHLCSCGAGQVVHNTAFSPDKLHYNYLLYLILSSRSSDTPILHCRTEQVYGDIYIYPYFDWITNAHYAGVKSINGLNLEIWEIEVKNTSHDLSYVSACMFITAGWS